MLCLAPRQGRALQVYTETGGRYVVGCIPYRMRRGNSSEEEETVEVMVISSRKGHGMMFPKGGWERDETMEQAAVREAWEEAGVKGTLEGTLGTWHYLSRRYGTTYEGRMYPLRVTRELPEWPEKAARARRWVTVAEAREGCGHQWMRDALAVLHGRLSQPILQLQDQSA